MSDPRVARIMHAMETGNLRSLSRFGNTFHRLKADKVEEIKRRLLAGESSRVIAKEMGISRNTAAKYRREAIEGGLQFTTRITVTRLHHSKPPAGRGA